MEVGAVLATIRRLTSVVRVPDRCSWTSPRSQDCRYRRGRRAASVRADGGRRRGSSGPTGPTARGQPRAIPAVSAVCSLTAAGTWSAQVSVSVSVSVKAGAAASSGAHVARRDGVCGAPRGTERTAVRGEISGARRGAEKGSRAERAWQTRAPQRNESRQ